MLDKDYDEGAPSKTASTIEDHMPTAAVAHSTLPTREPTAKQEPLQVNEEKISAAETPAENNKVSIVAAEKFSGNLAWETLCVCLNKDRFYHMKLQKHTDEATDIQDSIRKLIELSSQLPISEKDVVLSDDILARFNDLQKSNINILQSGEKKISPARMADIKGQIGCHNDRLKTELQKKFTTQIQVTISEMNSVLESARMIIKFYDRLMGTITNNQGKR
jgi:hypothetical protein